MSLHPPPARRPQRLTRRRRRRRRASRARARCAWCACGQRAASEPRLSRGGRREGGRVPMGPGTRADARWAQRAPTGPGEARSRRAACRRRRRPRCRARGPARGRESSRVESLTAGRVHATGTRPQRGSATPRRGGRRRGPWARAPAPWACRASLCTAGRARAAKRVRRGLHGRGPMEGPRGRERARGGESARALAWRAVEAGGRTILVLEAARTPAGRCVGATCTHRDGGQREAVSGTHGVPSGRSASRHGAARSRCRRAPRVRGGSRGRAGGCVGCAHRPAAEGCRRARRRSRRRQ
jgi:hypothetical protein